MRHFILTTVAVWIISLGLSAQCNPEIILSAGASNPFCIDDNWNYVLAIDGTNVSTSVGSWTGLPASATPGSSSAIFNPASVGAIGSYSIAWEVTTAAGDCMVGETTPPFTLYFDGDNSALTPGATFAPMVGCIGEVVQITGIKTAASASTPTFNYAIDGPNTDAPGPSVSPIGEVSATGAGMVTVIITETNGCNTSQPFSISIPFGEDPDIVATPSSETLCDGGLTEVLLTTNYFIPGLVEFWLTDLVFSDPTLSAPVSTLTAGPVGDPGTSTFLPNDLLQEILVNTGDNPQTATFTLVPTRSDGNLCEGDAIDVVITVMPTPEVEINFNSDNQIAYCSGEILDQTITTPVGGNGVTFDLVIVNTPTLFFTADLGDDQTFPIIIPGLVVTAGVPFEVSSLATAIINKTGDFDPGRIFLGVSNVRMTDHPTCTGPSIPPMLGFGQVAVIYPEPVLEPIPDFDICSGESFTLDFAQINNVSVSGNLAEGFPTQVTVDFVATNNDGGVTGATTETILIYDSGGVETSIADFSQTLTTNGAAAEQVTYTITPEGAGVSGDLNDPDNCPGEPIIVVVTVNPDLVATPSTTHTQICSGSTFSVQMLSSSTPGGGSADLEYLVTNISGTAAMGQGTTVIEDVTAIPDGDYLSETLTNPNPGTESVTYTIRPQLISSRTDPTDPTTATCFGNEVDITIDVWVLPTATVSSVTDPFCSGDTQNVEGIPAGTGPFTHLWEIVNPQPPGNDGTGTLDGAQSSTNAIANFDGDNPGTILLRYTATDANGCQSVPEDLEIEVIDLPDVDIPMGDFTICEEDDPVLITGVPTDDGGEYNDHPAISDNFDGTAEFDPGVALEGIHEVIYTYFDGDCNNSTSIEVTVVVCVPEATIVDPCSCRMNALGDQGNATNLENGQFTETVEVHAPSGQVWTVLDVDGLYDIASPQPPLAPIPIGIGTLLVEGPPGTYSLEGIHIDGIGYEITVTNGIDDLLMVSNQCFYPNPVIEGLQNGYCLNEPSVPLVGHADPSTGTGVFDILDEFGGVLVAGATEFDIAALGLGTFTVRYTFDEDDVSGGSCTNCNPGCIQAVEQEVQIIEEVGVMACNDQVNVSLEADCVSIIEADMVLEGDYSDIPTDVFEVEVFWLGQPLGNTVTVDEIGKILTVRITEDCEGNICWGSILVQDKLKPIFDCPDPEPVTCARDLDTIDPPTVTDNCDGVLTPTLISQVPTNFGCVPPGEVTKQVVRIWQAKDESGNYANNCAQVIEYIAADLSMVEFPPDYDDIDQPVLDCEDPDTEPDATGWPSIDGNSLDNDNCCSMNIIKSDQVIDICESSYKILRTWTVYDWCNPTSPDNPLVHIQVIKVLDQTAPEITCPDPLEVGMSGNSCFSFDQIPPADINNEPDCSDYSVMTSTAIGTITGSGNGGLLSGLPLGVHTITYQVIDACGNVNSCDVEVTVVDDVVPTISCIEFSTVTLNSVPGDSTFVFATSFDNGTYDNCDHLPMTIQAARMDNPTYFADQVGFTCDDVGFPDPVYVPVIVEFTDFFGNSNTCMVNVEVQIKNSPLISCPDDVTIDCSQLGDIDDPNLVGEHFIAGNCLHDGFDIVHNLDNFNPMCSTGVIVRTLTVESFGMTASCTQDVTLVDANPFMADDIDWPEDIDFNDCETPSELDPDDLPTGFDVPTFVINGCTNGVGFTNPPVDVIFGDTLGGCYKISRNWEVRDWCQPDSMWTYEQIIKVIDLTAPVLSYNGPTDFLCTDPPNLTIETDDCTPTDDMIITWEIDFDMDGTIDLTGTGMHTGTSSSSPYSAGTHLITYTVVDFCTNEATIDIVFTVGSGMGDPFSFSNPGDPCPAINIELNPAPQVTELPGASLTSIIGVMGGCNPYTIEFIDNAIVTSSLFFDCDDLTMMPTQTVEVQVTDAAGDQIFCMMDVTLTDPDGDCGDPFPMVAIAGGVYNDEDEPVNEVNISVNGVDMQMTEQDGVFDIHDLPMGGDYTLVPEKNTDLLNGVTTFDMTLISKHILNIKKLNSPYKIIAADVNNSGSVTTFDLVALRKVILHETDFFPNNASWRFIDNNYEFPEPDNPFVEPFPEFINFNNLDHDTDEADFMAIKVGDVNGSALPGNLTTTDDRNDLEPFIFEVKDRVVQKGEVVQVNFYPGAESALFGFQFTMEFQKEYLSLNQIVETEKVGISNFGLSKMEEGILLASWYKEGNSDAKLNTKQPIFAMTFTALRSALLSDVLALNSRILKAEAYPSLDARAAHPEIRLEFIQSINSGELALYQNHPNPFEENTVINFSLPYSSFVTLKIYDHAGMLQKTVSGFYEDGLNSISIDSKDLQSSGILIYQLETEMGILSKKMLRLP